MIRPILRLTTDELLTALDAIDPVDAVAAELVGGAPGSAEEGRLAPWQGEAWSQASQTRGLVLLEDLRTGTSCVLPAELVRGLRAAALATVAGRMFVSPGVVTAAVLGSGLAAQLSLTLLGRYLPGLSHVAVYPLPGQATRPLTPRVVDQLDLAGVGWSVAPSAAEAVFGATLVVTTVPGAPGLAAGQLAKGAVLVNTTGEDLPDSLVDTADEVYVDDATLIERSAHRYFARMHLAAGSITAGGPVPGGGSFQASGGRRRSPTRVAADFAQVLSGARAGRTHIDHVLLVELLGAHALDVRLACLLHRAARERGLGVRFGEG